MSVEQDVIQTLRVLPPEKQQEVLRFVQSLQPQTALSQKKLRLSFAEKLLPDLQRIHRDRTEPPSPVYADSLIRTMRDLRDRIPNDPFTQIVMALHNAMAFENRWVIYNGDQYLGAATLLQNLVHQDNLQPEDVQNAILALNRLGFETMPFRINHNLDADPEDEP